MDTSKKLYLALAVLAALAGGLYLQRQDQEKDLAAHSLEARSADLPKIEVSEEQLATIDRIEIHTPETAGKDADKDKPPKAAQDIVLKKTGEEAWSLEKPLSYVANASNVKSLVDNLKSLKISEQISTSAANYDKWGLSADKAVRAVFKHGDEVIFSAYFGEQGSRGQMTRLDGKDGVYAVKGYSKYLYDREVKGWRDKSIFKFEEAAVVGVEIANENGSFVFSKEDDAWKGQYGAKGRRPTELKRFKPSKVDDLVRAYKSLGASDFGDDKTPDSVGLTKPNATVTITLKDEGGKYVLNYGDSAEGTNRWAQSNKSEQIFSVSSWSADWATAEVSKFQDKQDG